MTKKILITGANGQLGHEMRNALKGNNPVLNVSLPMSLNWTSAMPKP